MRRHGHDGVGGQIGIRMEPICRGVFSDGFEIGVGIVENCIPGMNGCTIEESFGLKGEAGAIFRAILNEHGNVNLPCTEEELQVWKCRL